MKPIKFALFALLLLPCATASFADPSAQPSTAVNAKAPPPNPCAVNIGAANKKVTRNSKGDYSSAKLEAWIKAIRENHAQKTPVAADAFKKEFDLVTDMGGFRQLYQKYAPYMCTPDYANALAQFIMNMDKKELGKGARASLKKFVGDETFWMPSLLSIGKRIDAIRAGTRIGLFAFSGNATMQLNRMDQEISRAYLAQMQSMHGFAAPGTTNLLEIAKRDYADSFKYQQDFYQWVAQNL